ncbi:MAG: DUF3012 domain-containing protein [Alteromonadaceae bacterium]|nr:DUF3012 domain-containing protein [Alteromonadaceae bacterium]
MKKAVSLFILVAFIMGCAPEIGSKEWCENLKEKPKGDWTMTEMKDYTKHCIF